MKKIFSLDSPVVRFMAKLGTMILASLLWLVCSLPVVTFGASSAALYRVMFNLREDKQTDVKTFFRAFAENFRLGTLSWLSLIVFALVIWLLPQVAGVLGVPVLLVVFFAATCALVLIWWMVFVTMFPLVAFFDNSLKKTLRNVLFIMIKHRKQTILSALLAALPILILSFAPMVLLFSAPVWLLIFPGAAAYFTACRFAPVFEEYANRKKEESEEV